MVRNISSVFVPVVLIAASEDTRVRASVDESSPEAEMALTEVYWTDTLLKFAIPCQQSVTTV